MLPHRLRRLLPFWKQDIATLALVAIYVVMAFLLVLAWDHLSEKADAFVSDAKQINRDALADTARFQPPSVRHAQVSGGEIFGASPGEVMGLAASGASSTCGSVMAASCTQMRAILPQ